MPPVPRILHYQLLVQRDAGPSTLFELRTQVAVAERCVKPDANLTETSLIRVDLVRVDAEYLLASHVANLDTRFHGV